MKIHTSTVDIQNKYSRISIYSFLGRHWKEKVTSGQNYLDVCLGCLDHHPGHLVLLALLLPVSLCIYLASALVIFGVLVNTPPLQIVAIIIFP